VLKICLFGLDSGRSIWRNPLPQVVNNR